MHKLDEPSPLNEWEGEGHSSPVSKLTSEESPNKTSANVSTVPPPPASEDDVFMSGDVKLANDEAVTSSSNSGEEKDLEKYINHLIDEFDQFSIQDVLMDVTNNSIPMADEAAQLIVSGATEHFRNVQKLPFGERVLKDPKATAIQIKEMVMESVTKQGSSWIISLIPVNQIHAVCLIFLLGYVNFDLLLNVLPILVFYLSFLALILYTLSIFQSGKKLRVFETVFASVSAPEGRDFLAGAEERVLMKSLRPYWGFSACLVLCLFGFYTSKKRYILSSEFFVISATLALATYRGIRTQDPIATRAIPQLQFVLGLVQFVANNRLPLTALKSILNEDFIVVKLADFFYLTLGLSSCLFVAIVFLFVRLSLRHSSFMETSKVILPQLLTFFWLQLAFAFLQDTTLVGVVRLFMWVVAIPFIPFIGVGFLLLSLYLILKWCTFFAKVVVTVGAVVVPTVAVLLIKAKASTVHEDAIRTFQRRKSLVVRVLACSVFFVTLFSAPLLKIYLHSDEPMTELVPSGPASSLKWKRFSQICGQGSPLGGATSNTALKQIACHDWVGRSVSWEGEFTSVSIVSVENPYEDAFQWLPPSLYEYVKCVFGDPYPPCNETLPPGQDEAGCKIQKSFRTGTCHLRNRDVYKFLMVIMMDLPDTTINLRAGHAMKDVILALRRNDRVSFRANLGSGLGTSTPDFLLMDIDCVHCKEDSEIFKVIENRKGHNTNKSLAELVDFGLTKTFNFFFGYLLKIQNYA